MRKIDEPFSNKAVAVFRKSTVGTLCIIVVSLFIMGAECADNGKENELKEIPCKEYSLVDIDCQWTNLNYDGNVIVINNKTTMEKYVTCTNDSHPEIDFANNTLLLVHGTATSGGAGNIIPSFYQNYAGQYTLNVKVSLGITAIMQPWSTGIIVSKLPANVKINLNIQYDY
jgi:hypothetical protein